jgi:hypothetical protein
MFTDAEAAHDKLTMDAILPILEDLSIVVDEDTVLTIKNKTRLDRTSSAARNVLGMS